ncbi:MAG: DNA-directed RNA polymerase subunit omega [Saprospiraceae bacterium]|nr:DNA-directed RNA polymerase subunit omega [Saprospiraceae bacterium]
MADIKNQVQDINPNLSAVDIANLASDTGNIYEALAVISKRARQLNREIKTELQSKLEEFAIETDTIEEVQENKEQIEISKFYERLPNPTRIALDEYLTGKLSIEVIEDYQEERE